MREEKRTQLNGKNHEISNKKQIKDGEFKLFNAIYF